MVVAGMTTAPSFIAASDVASWSTRAAISAKEYERSVPSSPMMRSAEFRHTTEYAERCRALREKLLEGAQS